jgi:hypothetical protein
MSFKVSAQFPTTDRSLDFSWPTLAKLNKDLFLYPWSFGKEFDANLTCNMEIVSQGFYVGPPPLEPKYSAPTVPPANVLAKLIIAHLDQLFFILHPIGSGNVQEWSLVQVAFNATESLYSSCLMDSHYLVDFYLPHPLDFHYNAINKWFWLQYHSQEDIIGPTSSAYTHYIGRRRHLRPMLTNTTSSLTASF